MLRILSVLLLVLSGVAFWAGGPGRVSSIGMTVVEVQTALPVPLGPLLAGVGALLLGLSFARPGRKPERSVSEPPRDPVRARLEEGWKDGVFVRAAELTFATGIGLSLSPRGRAPFVLRVGDVPPERARRGIATLATFLAEVPLPARVEVRFDGFSEVGSTRKRLVNSAFAAAFPASTFVTTTEGGDVVVRFQSPDARWVAL